MVWIPQWEHGQGLHDLQSEALRGTSGAEAQESEAASLLGPWLRGVGLAVLAKPVLRDEEGKSAAAIAGVQGLSIRVGASPSPARHC